MSPPLEYSTLQSEHKREIVSNHLHEIEAEHYALSMRLRAYDGAQDVTEDNKREMIRQTKAQLASLAAAIEVYRDELSALSRDS